MAVLPTVGSSAGTWGTELNNWLLVAHNPDGTLKALSSPPSGRSLPTVGSSAGTWGTELNNWLLVAHNPDGTLKALSSPPSGLTLPKVGESIGTWGTELNAWLLVAHNADGTLKVVPGGPPAESISPLGFLSNRSPGYFPATHIEDYGVISSEGPAPAGFQGINLVYRSVISCLVGYTNMTDTECLSNGWQMIGTNGQVMRNLSYGGAVLGDPGLPGYQERWLELTLAYMNQHGADSFWGDDFTLRVADFNAGVWPQKYPNMTAYQNGALIPFAQFIKTELDILGIQLPGYNAGVSSDDNASLTAAWWSQVGPHVGFLSSEYWMHANGHVRLDQAGWDHNWPGWRNLHTVCNNAGCGFLPFPSSIGQVYILASFLLDYNGQGSCMWTPEGVGGGEYNSTTDPWIPEYGVAANLGTPSGPATKSGNVWTRQFANGTVTVNPVTGTASIQ